MLQIEDAKLYSTTITSLKQNIGQYNRTGTCEMHPTFLSYPRDLRQLPCCAKLSGHAVSQQEVLHVVRQCIQSPAIDLAHDKDRGAQRITDLSPSKCGHVSLKICI